MRSCTLILAAVLLLLGPASTRAQADSTGTRHSRAFAAAAVTIEPNMAEYGVPGTILVAVDRSGVVFEEGYGFANMEAGTSPDPRSTIFRIASVSKLFTALAALQEVGHGTLTLDGDVSEILAEDMLDNRVGSAVTLRQLLTHTSGLDRRNYGSRAASPAKVESLGEHLAHALPPVVRDPGEALIYSNYGFTLVGHLIERSRNEAFGAHVARTVFEPLGMSNSSFDMLGDAPGLATGYVDGQAIGPEPAHTAPAGRMSTNGADMARFMLAVLNGGRVDGRQVLDPNALDAMMQPQYRNAPGLPIAYGFGMWIHDRRDGLLDSAYHTGDMRGWSASVEFFPVAGFAVVMASNSAEGGNVHVLFTRELLSQLATAPAPVADARGPFERLPDQNEYLGEYIYGGVPETTFDRFTTLITGAEAVDIGPDGVLLVDGDPYVEDEPGLFRRTNDTSPRLAFVRNPRTGRMSIRTYARTYFEVTDAIPVSRQRLALFLSLGVIALSLLAWGVQALNALVRKQGKLRDRWLKVWASLCGLSYIGFIGGFAAAATGASMETGVPTVVIWLLVLVSVGAVMAVSMPVAILLAFFASDVTTLSKLHFAVFTVAALVATAVFWHWNVIGMRV